MSALTTEIAAAVPEYSGVRMTADEFYSLPDDGFWYELVDGVVIVSPSPTPAHQKVAGEISRQLLNHLKASKVGAAFCEVDVHLGQGRTGADLVYRPEAIFIRRDRLGELLRGERIVGVPDLVVEVVSPDSRRRDLETKKADYEATGVREYWVFDPERKRMHFFRLSGQRYAEVAASGDRFVSEAVPGSTLDLGDVRESFQIP